MGIQCPLVVLVLSLPCAAQTTWFVDSQGAAPGAGTVSDPYTSISFAMAQATTVDGDTVQVAQGTYFETLDFLGKALRVVGMGRPTIDAASAGSVVSFSSREGRDSVLENFELIGGVAAQGGGLRIEYAAPTIVDCLIHVNTAGNGGGVWTSRGYPRFDGCVIESNLAGDGSNNGNGGAIGVVDGRIDLVDCELRSNVAEDGGGLHLESARATVDGTTIENNNARDDFAFDFGGGVFVDEQSSLFLSNGSAVRGNRSTNDGAGIFCDGTLLIEDSLIEENLAGFRGSKCTSGSGGGIAAGPQATLIARDTTFAFNDGCFDGGALALETNSREAVLLERCTLTENTAQFGGGIYDNGSFGKGSVVVRDSELIRNHATSLSGTSDFGGGVYGPTTLERCLIEGNTASADGGGANGATLIDCDVIDNVVFDSDPITSFGGGLYEGTAIGCRFIGNRSTAFYGPGTGGAAVYSDLTDCVLIDNQADFGAGAAYSTLTNCTILENHAAMAGGAALESTLINSIARDNTPDQISGVSTATYCDVEGGHAGVGNFDANPLFWERPAGDLNLAPGSPCIDTGDPNGPPDSDGSRADVGALEFDSTYCPGPTNYCISKLSADACLPHIGTAGTPSTSGPDDFHLVAMDVPPGRLGLFILGSRRADAPLGGGRLCVAQFIRRPFVTSGGAGTCGGMFDDHVRVAEFVALGFVAGDCLSAQLWYRDGMHPDGTGTGLSDGVSFALLP